MQSCWQKKCQSEEKIKFHKKFQSEPKKIGLTEPLDKDLILMKKMVKCSQKKGNLIKTKICAQILDFIPWKYGLNIREYA